MTSSGPNSYTNLVEVAANEGSFNTFSKALTAAGLNDTLRGNGPYTVFAPTDQAFQKLPKARFESLFKLDNKTELADIMKYHISPGRLSATDYGKLTRTKTLQGQSATINMIDRKVMIDGSNVTLIGIPSSNGVMHAIDAVLIPTKH